MHGGVCVCELELPSLTVTGEDKKLCTTWVPWIPHQYGPPKQVLQCLLMGAISELLLPCCKITSSAISKSSAMCWELESSRQ